jgi:hypothetical protein
VPAGHDLEREQVAERLLVELDLARPTIFDRDPTTTRVGIRRVPNGGAGFAISMYASPTQFSE